MAVTSAQLTSRMRTWALVAALTALMITFGALLGNTFLWLFAALAVLANVGGYFYSDRIALRLSRAQPLLEADSPRVHATVRELAARAGIPIPRLYVTPGEQPNAFATGRNPQHAALAITEGLLASLPHEHVSGVLAHELAHIRNRDILISSVAATIAGAISAIANILQLSFLFGDDPEDNPLGLLGSLVALTLAPLAAMLLQLGVSRQREYLADATAARLLGRGSPLADALQTIDQRRAPALAVSPLMAPMYIVNPLAGRQFTTLFSTHPPVSERIRRLRAYDNARTSPPRHAGSSPLESRAETPPIAMVGR